MDVNKKPVIAENVIRCDGYYDEIKDWIQDEKGYVLIRIDKKNNKLELGFCKKDNVIEIIITGEKPSDIYFELGKRNLLSRPDHYSYVGKELQKAYIALKCGLEYVQDLELDLSELT